MAGGKYFYSKGEGNDGYIKNLEVLGYCDLDGKAGMFQMALYKTKEGKCINADINGALNIYRKSSVCDMKVIEYLLRRGVNTPKRLQVI